MATMFNDEREGQLYSLYVDIANVIREEAFEEQIDFYYNGAKLDIDILSPEFKSCFTPSNSSMKGFEVCVKVYGIVAPEAVCTICGKCDSSLKWVDNLNIDMQLLADVDKYLSQGGDILEKSIEDSIISKVGEMHGCEPVDQSTPFDEEVEERMKKFNKKFDSIYDEMDDFLARMRKPKAVPNKGKYELLDGGMSFKTLKEAYDCLSSNGKVSCTLNSFTKKLLWKSYLIKA